MIRSTYMFCVFVLYLPTMILILPFISRLDNKGIVSTFLKNFLFNLMEFKVVHSKVHAVSSMKISNAKIFGAQKRVLIKRSSCAFHVKSALIIWFIKSSFSPHSYFSLIPLVYIFLKVIYGYRCIFDNPKIVMYPLCRNISYWVTVKQARYIELTILRFNSTVNETIVNGNSSKHMTK